MISSLGDFILSMVCSLFGLLCNWQFLYVMKRDEQERLRRGEREQTLVQDVMTTFTIIQMIVYPHLLITDWYINSGFPLPVWTWHWFCYYRFYKVTVRVYLAFNSLVVASMRFIYILHNTWVLQFGKQRTKKLFYWLGLLIPLAGCTMMDSVHERASRVAPHFCVCLQSYEMVTDNSTNGHSINMTSFNSPAYSFVHGYIPASITNIADTILEILAILIFSNLVEGILYYKIFTHLRRYK